MGAWLVSNLVVADIALSRNRFLANFCYLLLIIAESDLLLLLDFSVNFLELFPKVLKFKPNCAPRVVLDQK